MALLVPSDQNKPTKRLLNEIDNNFNNNNEMKYENNIEHSGWLFKKSRVLRQWRKRWIVLKGSTMFTYKSQNTLNVKPTEKIEILQIQIMKQTDQITKKNDLNFYSFDLTLNEKLTFSFASTTNDDRMVWMKAITKLMNLNGSLLKKSDSNFGCKHFRRNCCSLCQCCDKWYFCSYCHDDAEAHFITNGHNLRRKDIVSMKCMKCGKEQKCGEFCKHCNLKMAHYYCRICTFWDNDPTHALYHCDKCGCCRSGIQNQYIHCDKCGVCLDKIFYKTHKCLEESTKCDCPICGDYLHMTDKPVTFWPVCGHAIHSGCMEELLEYHTLCPICQKPWMPES